MESIRQQKVSRLLQKEIGLLFHQQFTHLTMGNIVSVTVVRVTPDLSYAKVYMSAFPEKNPESLILSFNEHKSEITRALYPALRNQFRKMPELRFYYDDSLEYADRINQILKD